MRPATDDAARDEPHLARIAAELGRDSTLGEHAPTDEPGAVGVVRMRREASMLDARVTSGA